jgi:23S rRNA pseudouridine2605 synthase
VAVTAAQTAKAPGSGDRIAKLLARAGVGSRRDIERMIAEGRVALNGQVLETPATILKTLDGVTVDGKPVAEAQATRVFLFHKPAGVLTAARDPGGRATIYDVLPAGLPRLVPVGRLDLNTEGLLLLTNDGELKRALELPMNAVPRSYRVRALGEVRQSDLEALALGVTLDGVRYGPVDASVDRRARPEGANIWLTMTLTEGKNREVRKLCEAMGLKVSRLIRTAYGPFKLADLPVRGVDEVPGGAVSELMRTLSRRAAPPRTG